MLPFPSFVRSLFSSAIRLKSENSFVRYIPAIRNIHISRTNMTKALVLATYEDGKVFTNATKHFDGQVQGKLKNLVDKFGPSKKGKARIFYDLHPDYPVVSVVGLGSKDATFNPAEELDEKRENIRSSIAVAAKKLREETDVDEIHLDPCDDAEASAEGAHLALWSYDELKSEKYRKKVLKVGLYEAGAEAAAKDAFERGTKLAKAQNVCRTFADTPSNLLTPIIFGKKIEELFKNFPNVKVIVHDKEWAEQKKMGSFLSVAKGSAEPPKFVEIHYNNKPDSKPFVMVGKGICFDSGGISIKPAANMDKMRYDMSGAANVISTTFALASLQAKVNVVALAPLCENMPSGTAIKPGDVVYAMNGKSIQVDNTDAEGRLVLADALCYAHEFQPEAILDIATLTGAVKIALGSSASAVFTPSTKLFESIREAGTHTGDRVWRMPLWSHYRPQVTNSQLADCLNVGKSPRDGGSCTAAAFLSEFVTCPNWLHLDIAGVMGSGDEIAYYGKNMTGRPVRTLYYFVNGFFNNSK